MTKGQKAWTYGPQYLLSWSKDIGGAEKMNEMWECKNGLYCRYANNISKFVADDMIMLISYWYINESCTTKPGNVNLEKITWRAMSIVKMLNLKQSIASINCGMYF